MYLDTASSPTPTSTAAWLPRFVVLLIICVALAALAALALTLGHFVTPHLFSSLWSHPMLAMHPNGGCPPLIISC